MPGGGGMEDPLRRVRRHLRKPLFRLPVLVDAQGLELDPLIKSQRLSSSLPLSAAFTFSTGCVSSQSVRAAASGPIPLFCHHVPSSPQRWTSR